MNNDFTESFVWIDASDFVHLFAPVFVYSALAIAAWQFLKKRRDGQSS
jgi:ribose/xylose/arabinose/galactoside ABC-type transport system permease subunit